MGIESDQLVFDYLSRVGDLAQQRQLPSGARMKLVSSLRGEIDRRRATYGRESPTAVRSLLDELGSPDEVVDRAAGVAPSPSPSVPTPRPEPTAAGAAPPHLAGTDEVGSADTEPDWWRLDDREPALPGDDLVPGFRGGVEIPEILKPPPGETDEDAGEPGKPDLEAAGRRPMWRRVLRPRRRPEEEAVARRVRLGSPMLLVAALLLLGGAVFGSLVALALGWLLAYGSRRLSAGETRFAVVVLPLLAATAGVAWLWGRVDGRWGEPVAAGSEALGAAISETWPWTLKGAAIATSLYLLWRTRRHT
ncbi:hypothetical protein [Streptomyces sp. NPDC046182]|uniref:hypothetical protein n=1 Tax=Streptomyces sp. NPDC046182 TaxID=3154601 RepID=UPI0033DC7CDB